jgi:hypothetical protein
MSLLSVLGTAVVAAIAGAYLTKLWTPNPVAEIAALRRELAALREQVATSERERIAQKQEDELWTAKFETAAIQVVKIGPSLSVRSQKGDSNTPLTTSFSPTSIRKHVFNLFWFTQIGDSCHSRCNCPALSDFVVRLFGKS